MTGTGRDPSVATTRRGLSVRWINRNGVTRVAIRAVRLGFALVRQLAGLLLAVIIIFEEWGWKPLSAALARLATFRPIAALEAGVEALPPYAALFVFLAPSVLFIPLKLGAIWLIAQGYVVGATALFVAAKLAGTALFARIFQLTQPRLMELAWFARLYNWFMLWKEHLLEQARATRVWQLAAGLKRRVAPIVADVWARWKSAGFAAVARLRASLGR